jgi:hypothetical protein
MKMSGDRLKAVLKISSSMRILSWSRCRGLGRLPRWDYDDFGVQLKFLDVLTIISLPEHLRKTALAIVKLGEGTAADVAMETGTDAKSEILNLEELFKRDLLRKKKIKGKIRYRA